MFVTLGRLGITISLVAIATAPAVAKSNFYAVGDTTGAATGVSYEYYPPATDYAAGCSTPPCADRCVFRYIQAQPSGSGGGNFFIHAGPAIGVFAGSSDLQWRIAMLVDEPSGNVVSGKSDLVPTTGKARYWLQCSQGSDGSDSSTACSSSGSGTRYYQLVVDGVDDGDASIWYYPGQFIPNWFFYRFASGLYVGAENSYINHWEQRPRPFASGVAETYPYGTRGGMYRNTSNNWLGLSGANAAGVVQAVFEGSGNSKGVFFPFWSNDDYSAAYSDSYVYP